MPATIIPIARYTLLEAWRSRLWLLLLLGLAALFALARFAGSLSLTEHDLTELLIMAAGGRLLAVLLLSLTVVAALIREQHERMLEMVLALAVPRYRYFLGRLAGVAVMALGVALAVSALLLWWSPWPKVLLWGFSLWLELLLVGLMAMVAAFGFRQTPAALAAVAAFYLLARMIGALVLMAQHPIVRENSLTEVASAKILGALAVILPDLGRFAQTGWLTGAGSAGGLGQQAWILFASAGAYLLLLSAMALIDLYRKEF